MATPGSSFTPTPLDHEDNLEVRHHPQANALQPHNHDMRAYDFRIQKLLSGSNPQSLACEVGALTLNHRE
ncbi:hypothetical protein TNCV_491981 [Trichonephila clavipes]|nr:hypothetical protein TNCV_491981 [Trichonephila clavipes]